jgi:hypothetical protein
MPHVTTLPPQAEFEYKLLGYAAEEYPGLIPYLPPCKDQPLMLGAAEEAALELPCGLLPAALAEAEVESMPDALVCSPFVQLEMGSRYTNDQVRRLSLLMSMDRAQHDPEAH